MKHQHIIAIRRDYIYSLEAEQKDRDILVAVIQQLGGDIRMVDELKLTAQDEADIYLSMGRHPATLALLRACEKRGALVINCPDAVELCARKKVAQVMRENDIPMPPQRGKHGYWLKRGDSKAQLDSDVVYCKDENELAVRKEEWRQRGICSSIESAHVEGDLIKFYGVGQHFFKWFYRSVKTEGYDFDANLLQAEAVRLARIIGIDVYGGDCVVNREGEISIIDFNDWPSFAACKEEAAQAIAQLVKQKWEDLRNC